YSHFAARAGLVARFRAGARASGYAAVRALTGEFDGVDLGARPLRATQAEFDAAARALPEDLIAAIDVAVANVKKGHEDQLIDGETHREIRTETVPGVIVGERTRPLQSVALYVPRGKGSFPSVAIMLCAPAVVAGVARPIVVTPPGPNGDVDAATLVAAQKTGVTEVYRVGGVQAIAALAFGTGEIPRTPKVLGPGNAYVTAAKRALAGVIDPGVPAGPSESAILCDGTIHADIAAHDLLIEAEHGPDSCAVLVATSRDYARAVAARLPALVAALPEQRQAFITENFRERSKILVASDLDAAIEFVNEFAPEHLEILSDDAEALLERIENAGETMLGPHAPITLGNFVAGSNAILPTGGLARSASCLGVPDFQKRSSFVMASREGFERLAPAALTLADYEGFPAHAAAVRRRLS
ncbi:MAG: histidinol dehydrogenase, partial [Parvularculaceae bacterium]